MAGIFVFTAGNPEARGHLKDSILRPIIINTDTVLNFFPQSEHHKLRQIKEEENVCEDI